MNRWGVNSLYKVFYKLHLHERTSVELCTGILQGKDKYHCSQIYTFAWNRLAHLILWPKHAFPHLSASLWLPLLIQSLFSRSNVSLLPTEKSPQSPPETICRLYLFPLRKLLSFPKNIKISSLVTGIISVCIKMASSQLFGTLSECSELSRPPILEPSRE